MLLLCFFVGEVVGILIICVVNDVLGDVFYLEQVYCDIVGVVVLMVMLVIECFLVLVYVWVKSDLFGEVDECMVLVIEGSGIGIWDCNVVIGEMYYLCGWKVIFGYEDWEFFSYLQDVYQCIYLDDLFYVQEIICQYFVLCFDIYQVEYCICCCDGSYKWISSCGKVVVCDVEGNVLCMIGIIIDIIEVW